MPTEVEGIAQVTAALTKLVLEAADAMALAAVTAYEDEIAPYPPATAANNPRPGWYYIRGKGAFYQSKRTGATKQLSSSQTLGRRWKIIRAGAGLVYLTNDADYVLHVHGSMERKQATAMGRIGWKDTQESVQVVRQSGKLDVVMARVIRKLIKEVGL